MDYKVKILIKILLSISFFFPGAFIPTSLCKKYFRKKSKKNLRKVENTWKLEKIQKNH